ncbi:hypothetical protein ACM7WR_24955 [Pseudomonas aeruginosa]
MSFREFAVCLAAFLLILSGLVFGIKFLRKRNYLLGLEWLVVAFSATNALLYFTMGWVASSYISLFCDAFSRGFGIPIVAVIGMMAVTHGYKPSIAKDFLFFGAAIAGTFVLVLSSAIAKPLPYFYVVMWSLYSVYLAFVICKLANVGEYLHAVGLTFSLLAGQAIATIYDFYKIPGDDETKTVFYTFAMLVWAYNIGQTYFAYCALERGGKKAGAVLQAR